MSISANFAEVGAGRARTPAAKRSRGRADDRRALRRLARGPPDWQGRQPDLVCDVCGYRYWRYAGLRSGSPCPWPAAPNVACLGRMVDAEIDEAS